ncbi:class I SAM-dependent methyltransferase [Cytobacillus sp. IB215316]|uniref:class I SAM-dependent methyltransferase n=1 Tax=Cytobacillus sp. IB215316 TaxID=3097354 RepID=UPI002A167AA2|nr:class I SAM-dependent methyltransferase [Cytobacillus sp. IB215316]MDX8362624.1 class I SAM-dependent methyltransferase [Cytobacillus sp. IB215316]
MNLYYSNRAQEYERVYYRNDEVRQKEQAAIRESMSTLFVNKHVLEVACGTGYWTQFVAQDASHITAIDFSEEVLEIAVEKNLPSNKVLFQQANAYELNKVQGNFNASFANYWFSHIPKNEIEKFLKQLHARVGTGAQIFMADNVYIESIGGSLIEKAGSKDTYKLRTLENGSQYEVIKNYYNEAELREIFTPYARNLDITIGQCFWWISYLVK